MINESDINNLEWIYSTIKKLEVEITHIPNMKLKHFYNTINKLKGIIQKEKDNKKDSIDKEVMYTQKQYDELTDIANGLYNEVSVSWIKDFMIVGDLLPQFREGKILYMNKIIEWIKESIEIRDKYEYSLRHPLSSMLNNVKMKKENEKVEQGKGNNSTPRKFKHIATGKIWIESLSNMLSLNESYIEGVERYPIIPIEIAIDSNDWKEITEDKTISYFDIVSLLSKTKKDIAKHLEARTDLINVANYLNKGLDEEKYFYHCWIMNNGELTNEIFTPPYYGQVLFLGKDNIKNSLKILGEEKIINALTY